MSHAPESGTSPYLNPGHVLGERYEIEREIGRGGYSVVYLARDRELGTGVAVKLLVPPPALAKLARERMRREAIAARGLAHPNIVGLHDFLEDGPWSYLVMEYVDGPDLRERVDTRGPLSPDEVVRIGADVAAALDAAHRQGILHRDVKPQNVLLAPDGRARLTDFGSARLESQATVTATGGIVGTLAYAAPEEMAGQRADARSDVFSLGLTLYFALTGELPGGPGRHLPPVSAEGGHRTRSVKPQVPRWLDDVVGCATSAAPGRRFPTAGSMREALLEANGDAGIRASGTSGRIGSVSGRAHAVENGTARGSGSGSGVTFPYSELGDWCPLCGASDELDIGVCPGCADGSRAADTLLFVAAPSDRPGRADVADHLSCRLGRTVSRTDLLDLMSGRRPLALIPATSADAAVARLAERSIPASAEPARRAWRRIPSSFLATLLAVLVAGLVAGVLAAPSMLLATPLFAALLAFLAVRRLRTPMLRRTRGAALQLPPAAEGKVRDTLTSIPGGPARRLLQDVVRMAAGVHAQGAAPGGPDVEEPLAGLLRVSCDVVIDLGHLDESLMILEGQKAQPEGERDGWLESQTRARRARDGLTQKLLEAMAVLGRTRIAIASGEAAADRLTAFAAELEGDATAHAEARREVEALAG